MQGQDSTETPDPIPLAVNRIMDGIQDLEQAVDHTPDVGDALRLLLMVKPLVLRLQSVENRAGARADWL